VRVDIGPGVLDLMRDARKVKGKILGGIVLSSSFALKDVFHSHEFGPRLCRPLSSVPYLAHLSEDVRDDLVEVADDLEHGVVREELGGELALQQRDGVVE